MGIPKDLAGLLRAHLLLKGGWVKDIQHFLNNQSKGKAEGKQ